MCLIVVFLLPPVYSVALGEAVIIPHVVHPCIFQHERCCPHMKNHSHI